jgi:hypothetical protein
VSLQLELLYAYALILSPINSTNFTPYTPWPGGTVFFVYKITRRHKQEGHNMHGDESVVTITRRPFQLEFRGTEFSRISEVSVSLSSAQLPFLCTQ